MSNIGERPGVYASYEVSGVSYSGLPAGTVGVAAAALSGESGKVHGIRSYAEAVRTFGAGANISELVRILIKNGVSLVKAVPLRAAGDGAADAEEYGKAFEMLAADGEVKVIVCDGTGGEIAAKMKSAIMDADDRNGYKIGIVDGSGSVSDDIAAAQALNCERMVIVTPPAVEYGGGAALTGSLSSAVAGAIAAGGDPAVPLNGAEIYGLGGVSAVYDDADITALVRGGVTPVESIGGSIRAVRGITTRTKTGDVPDATYRELTTTLIIDDVVPSVRNALAASFTRAKNNAQTRGAIRTRVILELEKKLAAEIIDGYDNVKAEVNPEDPTVCDVSFEFTVAHGLNQIRLTAYITV